MNTCGGRFMALRRRASILRISHILDGHLPESGHYLTELLSLAINSLPRRLLRITVKPLKGTQRVILE